MSVPVPTGSWPGRARPRPWWPRSGSTRQTAGAVLVRATPSVDAVSDGIPAPRSRSLTRALASPYGAPRSRRAASASGGVKVVRTVSAFARAAPSSRRWSRSTPSASGDVVDRSPAPALAAAVWACRLTSWLWRGHAHLAVAHGRLIQISSESFWGVCPTWANARGEIPRSSISSGLSLPFNSVGSHSSFRALVPHAATPSRATNFGPAIALCLAHVPRTGPHARRAKTGFRTR